MSKPAEANAAARWREIVWGHADSGLLVAAYCRRARVPQASFYAWRRRLRVADSPRRDGTSFAEVRVTPVAPPDAGTLEVRLPGGRGIVVRPGFDRQTLRDLVATLEQGVAGPADDVADGGRGARRGTDVAPVRRRGARP